MKNFSFLLAVLFCFMIGQTNAQNETIKAQLASRTVQSDIQALLASKNFEFAANTMLPLGQPPKNLVGSDYSVTFSPEMIVSNMPYYGRAYSTIMGRDKGMRFKGAPEIFTVSADGGAYGVQATVKNETDTFSISLVVEKSGFVTLGITTADRQSVTYQGEVRSVKK